MQLSLVQQSQGWQDSAPGWAHADEPAAAPGLQSFHEYFTQVQSFGCLERLHESGRFCVLESGIETLSERLDKYLAHENLATSRTEAGKWIEDGLVRVNGQVRKASYSVQAGDEISIQKPSLKTLDLIPKEIDFEILFEDEYLLVLNKPAGLVVHPGAGNYDESLVHGLLYHCQGQLSGIGGVERPGIVHRLDKGTSGLMVVAKTDVTHQKLTEQFQNRQVEKEYLALVLGSLAKNEVHLDNLIKRSEMNRKKFMVNQKKGRRAVSHIFVERKNSRVSLVRVKIETGRTHQVRVHLSFIGHPVVGDATYGGIKKLSAFSEDEKKFIRDLGRPLLHSHQLAFVHPVTGEKLRFEAEVDEVFAAALRKF